MTDTFALDRYVVDTLMRDLVGHDHRPSAYLVYLCLLGAAEGSRVALSHAQLAEATGLSKRGVQDALNHLAKRRLVSIKRVGRTEAATIAPLTPWRSRPGGD